MSQARIGIIGGSGLYQMPGLTDVQEHSIDTPFGAPSDPLVTGNMDGVPVVFLARHGRDHRFLPTEVPYRANIHALKQMGVRYLVSFSAVGSLQAEVAPRDMLIPDQYIDLTRHRVNTFFGEGVVAHVALADPVCAALSKLLAEAVAAQENAPNLHTGGTYVCMEGPQFSTRAESQWYRQMGASVIGMTNMPEARLAREAQMAYASLAMVTDYDSWNPKEDHVTAELAIANLMHNADNAKRIARTAIELINRHAPESQAHQALKQGLVTPMEQIPEARRALVELLLQ
ncbi:S-methyl-5'-thioadenosine phosphorylase [Marinobacterium sp. AK62]|uniref:S-methyl-5'-thioadenosine phosphorylase n=1 Tax=Marinobacterium alkalitolerans TaxID=1542925 RepID=A0ABS3ZBN9_9GAMM|nr:S-methyl-5'-thioadenosine phosphorylase [Marinobacterium alkalitolerans]MBP0049074.1 S-methyl-5'-thioadenosine phosphorylase [Marinobacterium alkalitolerans]